MSFDELQYLDQRWKATDPHAASEIVRALAARGFDVTDPSLWRSVFTAAVTLRMLHVDDDDPMSSIGEVLNDFRVAMAKLGGLPVDDADDDADPAHA